MKKLYYILTLVVAAMTISACNNAFEDEGPALNGGEGSENTITFVVGPETDAEGRTVLDLVGDAANEVEGGEITLWNGTETAGLYYNYRATGAGSDTKVADAQNIVYTATLGSDSATATFTGEAEWVDVDASAHKFYFYYPYNEDTESHTKVHGTLPAEQTYDATASKWDMSAYDFVYANNSKAMPENAVELEVMRAFSVLRLGITNNTKEDVEIQKVTLASKGGRILAGKFIVNASRGNIDQALLNTTTQTVTKSGYWTEAQSAITTKVSNGTVKADETIDVRFMINAGYAAKVVDEEYGEEDDKYFTGDTFVVTIVTDKGTHPVVEFKAGALLRGARAGKSITLEPIPPGEPNATSVVSNDSNEAKFYLNNTITITGTNLLNAQAVKVGGVAAEVVSQTGTELVVKVPDCTGTATTAADHDITYTYEDEEGTLGTISIYPFYHYENMMLGCGSNSKDSYSEFASLNSFFYPDLGESVAVSKWKEDKLDKWALGDAPTPVVHDGSNKYVNHDTSKISEAEYYSVLPYFFFITNSSHKFTLVTPCNSPNGLKCHFIDGVSVSTQSGTPNLWFRNMRTSTSAEKTWYDAVKNGDITEMTAASYTGSMASAGAPEFKGASTDLSSQASQWHVGSVIMMQYVTYEKASKPSAMSDVAKFGFIHIKEVTCADLETGLALPTREGHIKFDLYWSKELN